MGSKEQTSETSGLPIRPLHLCTPAVLEGLSIPPAGWQILSDIDSLGDTELPEPIASLWLHYDKGSVIAEREQQISQLRAHLGPNIPILLVERGIKLRHIHSMRLISRGITQILPDIGVHDLLRIAISWQNLEIKHISRPSSDDDGEAVPAVTGYLAPNQFHQLAGTLLSQDATDGIQSALLRLRPLPGFSLSDVAQAYTPNREHDVFTLDEQHLYLFLHGCMDTDIDIALDHLFSLPPSQLFAWEQRFVTHSDIMAELIRIQHKAEIALPTLPNPGQNPVVTSSAPPSDMAGEAVPMPLNWPSDP